MSHADHSTESAKQRYEIERMSARIRSDLIRVLPKHKLQEEVDKVLFNEVCGMAIREIEAARSTRQYDSNAFPSKLARASSAAKLLVTLIEDMLHIEDAVSTANGLVKAEDYTTEIL